MREGRAVQSRAWGKREREREGGGHEKGGRGRLREKGKEGREVCTADFMLGIARFRKETLRCVSYHLQ